MNLAPSRVAAACRALIAAPWFNAASFSVIVINAVVLGLETYDGAVTAAESGLNCAPDHRRPGH